MVRQQMEKDKTVLQCPACGVFVSRNKRNCDNPDCSVGNIRKAIAEANQESRISTERQRQKKVVTCRPRVTRYDAVMSTTDPNTSTLQLKRRASDVPCHRDDEPCTKKEHVTLLEPCFVNPNSHEAVEVILRNLGHSAGLKQYGGDKREWLVIECDGLPNVLVRKVIHQSKEKAKAEALANAGIPHVEAMSLAKVREELKARQIRSTLRKGATAEQLKERFRHAVQADIASGKVVMPAETVGEFDWVVLRSGGLH